VLGLACGLRAPGSRRSRSSRRQARPQGFRHSAPCGGRRTIDRRSGSSVPPSEASRTVIQTSAASEASSATAERSGQRVSAIAARELLRPRRRAKRDHAGSESDGELAHSRNGGHAVIHPAVTIQRSPSSSNSSKCPAGRCWFALPLPRRWHRPAATSTELPEPTSHGAAKCISRCRSGGHGVPQWWTRRKGQVAVLIRVSRNPAMSVASADAPNSPA
jgi:hypothetical protein